MTWVTISSEVRADVIRQVDRRASARALASGTIFTTLPDGHGDEAVHLQDRQERLVEGRRRHRRRGQHRHLRAHPRVDDEVLAGGAATASAICVMSASLKFGVMRWRSAARSASDARQQHARPRAGQTNEVRSRECCPENARGLLGGFRRRGLGSGGRAPAPPGCTPSGSGSGRRTAGAAACPGRLLFGARCGSASWRDLRHIQVRSCCWPLRITVTRASLEVPRVRKISWPRAGSSSGRAVDRR